MNQNEAYRDDADDGGHPPWLADWAIAAVVGAWEQDERSRQAARLLQRVHRCARPFDTVPPKDFRLCPETGLLMMEARARGWLD